MAGSFSSKKVARAARTGGTRRRGFGSAPYGWYALLAVLIILGSSLVAFSRNERLDAKNPGTTPPLAQTETRAGDHWHEAYGVYICDKFVANINDTNDPYGIATENDGVIHIHPYLRKYAGHNATLGLFAKAVKLEVDRDSVKVPKNSADTSAEEPKTYKPGEKCGDKDGELIVKEWTDAKDDKSGKVIKVNPKDLLLKNNAAVTIAFVPKGITDIPRPASADTLDQVVAKETADAQAQQEAAAAQQQQQAPATPETSVTPNTAAP